MAETKKLIIVAAGAFAREVLWVAREARDDDWEVLGFLDDDPALTGTKICDLPVLGSIDSWADYPDAHFVIAIGPPRPKKAVHDRMVAAGQPKFATLVHRSAQMSEFVTIGEGSVICAGCVLTTQIEVRKHVILNLICSVGHDTILGDFCTFAPQCAGSSLTVEAGADIGMFTTLLPGVTLGSGSQIGMGSVVTKSIPANELWLGSPAKLRRELPEFPR
ncbi:acetyltransferase [Qipengyuania oceanensis]|uniref:Acetyltransferase n=1 Tax=Qipengyuania oceanensis TaxID=1463597 RepID=A0A844YF03_9SPHN|nr:acetyltransferase [Qipengyuania oceanensis]MXO63110.1 acetyltransferase [Qipengyuania oceanensis]